MIALNGGKPEMMTLQRHAASRSSISARRSSPGAPNICSPRRATRAHLQVGLAIAVANIDEVIRLIRTSPDPAPARAALMERAWPARDMAPLIALIADPRHTIAEDGTIRLSEAQARAILELRLARLTALGRDEIAEALNKLAVEIADYLDILGSRARLMGIIRDELVAVKTAFADKRRTEILDSEADMDDEDLIQREDMVVLVSHGGYIKRVPLSTYRAQRRGGKGRSGMATREEDFVARLFVASTHQPVLYFSSKGQVYKEKVWRLPLAAPQARGKALVNLLPLEPASASPRSCRCPRTKRRWEALDVMFATTRGTRPAQQALRLRAGQSRRQDRDEARRGRGHRRRADLLGEGRRAADDGVGPVHPLRRSTTCACSRAAIRWACAASRSPRATRDLAGDPAPVRRRRRGARGLSEDAPRDGGRDGRRGGAPTRTARARRPAPRRCRRSATPQMSAAEQFILTISENGYGKRTSSFEYRLTGRGGKGIVAMAVNARNGKLVASFPVEHGDEVMLVTDGGQLIRCPVEGIRIAGRATQGVIVFDTADEERVVSVERISEPEATEAPDTEEGGE